MCSSAREVGAKGGELWLLRAENDAQQAKFPAVDCPAVRLCNSNATYTNEDATPSTNVK
jgi:hypothetical protein